MNEISLRVPIFGTYYSVSCPERRSRMFLLNTGKFLPDYTVSDTRSPCSSVVIDLLKHDVD